MRWEPHEDGPSVNIVTWSRIATEEDKGKQPEENVWVRKDLEKEARFDMNKVKETLMEEKRGFVDVGASTSRAQSTLTEKPAKISTEQETNPSLLTYLLHTYMKCLMDQKVVEGLKYLIDNCNGKGKLLPKQYAIHKIDKGKKSTGCKMRLTTQIGEFEMDQLILDLGSDVNVLLKQTWERMGKLMLQWSPIQLRMENQQKIILMGCLHGVTVDIEGSRTIADFEVIEIVDDSNPYLALLGIDWEFDMNVVINMKKRNMTFEKKELRVIVTLDSAEGVRYIEPVRDYYEDDDIEKIYKINTWDED